MAAASNFTETLALNFLLTTGTATRPTAWYIGLHTADVTDAGSGTEVSGFDYARQTVAFDAASGTNPTFCDNTSTITFPTANGGNWGTISHIGIWSALSGGTLYFHGQLSTSKVVNDGDTFQILAGNLVINLA